MTKYFELLEHQTAHPMSVATPNWEGFAYSCEWYSICKRGEMSFSLDQWAEDSDIHCIKGLDLIASYSGNVIVSEKFCNTFQRSEISFFPVKFTLNGVSDLDLGSFYISAVNTKCKMINETLKPISFWPKLKKFKSESFVIDQVMPVNHSIVRDESFNELTIVNEDFVNKSTDHGLKVGFRELPILPDLYG